MSDTLSEICARKRADVAARKAALPERELRQRLESAPPEAPRGFARALVKRIESGGPGLICEIKKASPSKGLIRADFAPPALARAYAAGGASCLSVLTDTPYFQGRPEDLTAARAAVELPVLCKDFILEDYQLFEARLWGADCILLILAALEDDAARRLALRARELGMDVLLEVHDGAELERAQNVPSDLIGINNRDLKSLRVDIETSLALAPRLPPGRIAVAESGLATPADLARCAAAGIRAFLIGESLMRADDVTVATRRLARAVPDLAGTP